MKNFFRQHRLPILGGAALLLLAAAGKLFWPKRAARSHLMRGRTV